ncbi:Hypothetical predicted protein [Mytilus galloprovincialis]|uniref:Uncharacterized protein n=1 Tax=Mytilus galloprovincialis TaxID=29158 RepID=A0A8B6ESN1_MYTGA|nr:Hypothetical predicted protein [Mytilus galloprovincialis]
MRRPFMHKIENGNGEWVLAGFPTIKLGDNDDEEDRPIVRLRGGNQNFIRPVLLYLIGQHPPQNET